MRPHLWALVYFMNTKYQYYYSRHAKTLEYTSYIRGPVCTPKEPIRHPTTNSEVVRIVKEAIERGTTCKAFGQLHSATDIICTDGIPIDMTGIRRMRLNSDQTVTAGAGVSLRDLSDFLMESGRGVRTVPGYGNITVGGAIGTGAHGSSIKYTSSISEQVVGMLIVDGMAQVRKITAEEDLKAFRVNLGLLGVILEVTLKTVPLYKVRAYNYIVSDRILTNGSIEEMARNTDQLSIYWFPSFHNAVVSNWTIVDVGTPGDAWTNDHVPSTSRSFQFYSTRALEVAQAENSINTLNIFQAVSLLSLNRTIPDFPPIYTEDGVHALNPAVGYYHRMFAPICQKTGWKQCPWLHGSDSLKILDNEFGLELRKLPAFVRTVKDILAKYPAVFPFQGILLRFSAASKSYMSVSQGRDTCHFEFYVVHRKDVYENASLGLAAFQAIVQSLVKTKTYFLSYLIIIEYSTGMLYAIVLYFRLSVCLFFTITQE